MKLAELRTRLRDAWSGDSPQLVLALIFGGCAGFAATGSLLLVTGSTVPTAGSGVIPPVWNVSREFSGILFLLCFVVGCPFGAFVGWRTGGFIHDTASTQHNLAAVLLFIAMFVPIAFAMATFSLVPMWLRGRSYVTFTDFGELSAWCAFAAVVYRLAIARAQRHGDKPRGSGESAIDDRSTINDQP